MRQGDETARRRRCAHGWGRGVLRSTRPIGQGLTRVQRVGEAWRGSGRRRRAHGWAARSAPEEEEMKREERREEKEKKEKKIKRKGGIKKEKKKREGAGGNRGDDRGRAGTCAGRAARGGKRGARCTG